jgi:hypothetical protein
MIASLGPLQRRTRRTRRCARPAARNGFLAQPWLGDETSGEVAAHYTRRAMEAPDSSYRSLQQYRAELSRVHDTLQRMEDQYLGADQDAADRHRRV